ncbi:sugar-transfer associated ATP-grasp domain-containing protein [Sulfitobacter sabulilitoris]|uniref:ATP-grasp domain-containing protein n=1 Tax=Sulfitobacter sabulilitoris TaxID=2562655 RepID=A0A5S3P6C9_9RHOB|nr:sugar-transfer associated ATP-grasp domain-containing protein [Sulfitobacter sabulilitoris]TMM48644.1 hypothetical protein FDT80_18770 [Sulfitobacter sabulilitoris]
MPSLDEDGSAFVNDFSEYKTVANKKPVELILFAHQKSGRSMWEIGREFKRLSRGEGKLTLQEYIDYEVYNAPDAEKERFLSRNLVWPVTTQCCDMTWDAATEDKWLATQILELHQIPTPPILAVVDANDRRYGRNVKLSSARELEGFLNETSMPIFAKANRGHASFGTFLIRGHSDNGVELHDGETVGVSELFEDRIGDRAYVLQPLLRNSEEFAPFAKNLITLRLFAVNDGKKISVVAAVLKVPSDENIADNFWRPGNIVGDVDLSSGIVTTAKTRHEGIVKDVDATPATSPTIVGHTITGWEEAVSLARDCSRIFPMQRFLTLDVALTDQGPCVVEVNTGGGWELYQFASGKGFLTPEVTAFFAACNVDLDHDRKGGVLSSLWKRKK